MLPEDFDLSDYAPDSVEAVAAAGGMVPPGKYHVRLDGASDGRIGKSGNPSTDLEYTILTGPFAGKTVKDSVWHPAKGDNGPSANRFVLVAHRLGLFGVNPKTKRYELVKGKDGFGSCLGAEVVIEVNHRTYTREDKSEGKAVNVTFGGIYAVNDPKVKDVPKAAAGAKVVAQAKAAATDKKFDPNEL